jgi:hypothetical protein
MELRRIGLAWLVGIALVLGGHALAADKVEPPKPDTGLAIGAFDVTRSELAVTHVVLMRLKPARMYMGSSGEKKTVTYDDGKFYCANLAPGVYAVMGFFSGNKFFGMERSLRTNRFEVVPGGVAYAGSYTLTLTKGGLFRNDRGTFDRVDSPAREAALLDWLGQELGDSGWASVIAARKAATDRN